MKLQRRHLGIPLVMSVALVATQAWSATPDMSLAGLHFGMTPDQVKSVLMSRYNLEARSEDDPNTSAVVGLTEDKSDALTMGYANNRLWFIKHTVDFPPGRQPTLDGFKKQLASKFGAIRGVGYKYYTWIYNRAGRVVNDAQGYAPEGYSACGSIEEQGPMSAADTVRIVRMQPNFSENCGAGASATWYTADDNPGLVSRMQITVSDQPYMFTYLANQKSRADLKRQEDLQKARKNNAPL